MTTKITNNHNGTYCVSVDGTPIDVIDGHGYNVNDIVITDDTPMADDMAIRAIIGYAMIAVMRHIQFRIVQLERMVG